MESEEAGQKCPLCAGELIYRDRRKRIFKKLDGTKRYLMIRRLRCKTCGKMCSELPDCILPHKHYAAEVIYGVLASRITEKDEVDQDYPSPDTMRRWKINLAYMTLK